MNGGGPGAYGQEGGRGGSGGDRGTEGFTYPGVGATALDPERWPAGYRRLHVSALIGSGEADFRAAAEAVLTWRMQRAMGVEMGTDAPRAAPGVRVSVGLGTDRPLRLRLRAPCRVVWTAAEERRAGWAYGTLPGHPVRGEEAFLVSRAEEGTVRLDVTSFSRPAVWWTSAAGPLLPFFQHWYARRCGTRLRALVRAGRGQGNGTEGESG